jgi:branched-chain amino acid aminotransferase
MSECFRSKYIYNDEVRDTNDFQDQWISKGTSLYEVIRIIKGTPLFYHDHYERLRQSSQLANLSLLITSNELKSKIIQLCKLNRLKNGNVKIVLNYDGPEKSFLVYFIKHSYPNALEYKKGVPVMLFKAERQNPNAKIIDNNLRSTINVLIKEKKVFEVLLVNQSGNVTEGSRSNFFALKGTTVFTAPLSEVLPGITRKYVILACTNLGLEVKEQSIPVASLNTFASLFISGTSPKVLPICKVDNNAFSVESIFMKRIMKEYNRLMKVDIA